MGDWTQKVKICIWVVMGALVVYLFGITGNTEEIAIQGHSAIIWMVGRWNLASTDMSHGWLIPFVSLYMVWWKRNELGDASKRLSWFGFGVVVAALLLYMAGLRVQQTRIVLVSLIALLWGIPFFLFGKQAARILAYPCAYLLFCIPMTFLDDLTFGLRLISTTVSTSLLNGLGIATERIGTGIHVKAGAGLLLDVAQPCSGLHYLLAMVALTTAYAFFTQRSPVKRAILCVSAVPLAMAGNVVRITLIALVGICFGAKLALGFYHDYSGYVVFLTASLLMLGIGNLLELPWLKRQTGESGSPVRAKENLPSPRQKERLPFLGPILLLVLLGMVAIAVYTHFIIRVTEASLDTSDIRQELPDTVGDWRGEDVFYCQNDQCARSFLAHELGAMRTCPVCGGALARISLGERTLLPHDTLIVRKAYFNPGGKRMLVTIVLSGSEQRSIHRPQQCLPAQGFAIEQSSVLSVPLAGRPSLSLALIHATAQSARSNKSAPQTVLAYWFAGGGHETCGNFERLAFMAWDNLFHGIRSRWAYVSLQTQEDDAVQPAEHRIAEFIYRLYPMLKSDSREGMKLSLPGHSSGSTSPLP